MSMPSLFAAVALVLSPVHVTLVFAPDHRLPPAVQRAAMAEAAAIWRPHGVAVTGAEAWPAEPHSDLALTVVMSAAPPQTAQALRTPLGAVDFDAQGTPLPIITVFIARLLALIQEAHLGDVPAWQWPRVVREQIAGRAIGRVLAHEIGHVLLRTREHDRHGLMRALQRTDELVDPERTRYRLTR